MLAGVVTFLSLLLCAQTKEDFSCTCEQGQAKFDVQDPKGDYWVGLYTDFSLRKSVGCGNLRKGEAYMDISDLGTQTLFVAPFSPHLLDRYCGLWEGPYCVPSTSSRILRTACTVPVHSANPSVGVIGGLLGVVLILLVRFLLCCVFTAPGRCDCEEILVEKADQFLLGPIRF